MTVKSSWPGPRHAQPGARETSGWSWPVAARERTLWTRFTIWQREIERVIYAKNNQAYAEAVELIVRVRRLLLAADREADFAPYLAKVRAAHKPKRNPMKLFDERSW